MSPWLWLYLYIESEEKDGIDLELGDWCHFWRLWEELYEWEMLRNDYNSIWREIFTGYGQNYEVRTNGEIVKEFTPATNEYEEK